MTVNFLLAKQQKQKYRREMRHSYDFPNGTLPFCMKGVILINPVSAEFKKFQVGESE